MSICFIQIWYFALRVNSGLGSIEWHHDLVQRLLCDLNGLFRKRERLGLLSLASLGRGCHQHEAGPPALHWYVIEKIVLTRVEARLFQLPEHDFVDVDISAFVALLVVRGAAHLLIFDLGGDPVRAKST